MSPVRLLLLQANPDSDLNIDGEERALRQALDAAEHGRHFEIHRLPAAHVADIQAGLRRYRPHLLHVAVHGVGDEQDGRLILCSSTGERDELTASHLAEIVRLYQAEATEKLRCVVLGGCHTDATARLLAAHVDVTVGIADDIDDATFQYFTPALYAAIADGRSLPNAMETAIQELRNRTDYEVYAELIHIHIRYGVNTAGLTPVRWLSPEPPRQSPPLSPRHRQYLAQVCGAMKRVNLANILETQRREPELLDIYVPLPVDAELVLEMRNTQVTDWWLSTGGERGDAAEMLDERLAAIRDLDTEATARQRPKTWTALRLDASDLAPLVEYVRGKLARQIAEIAEKKDSPFGRRGEETLRWRVDAEQAASRQPRMVLIGDPGSGKSSFLRHLALCLAGECLRRTGDSTTPGRAGAAQLSGWLAPPDLTPIYIELRALVAGFPPLPEPEALPKPEGLPTLAGHFWPYVQAAVLDTPLAEFGQELATLCLDGKAILLLDGLDEVSQAETAERRRQIHHLIQQLTDTYPKLRIMVGSRPYAYEVGDWALDGFGVAHLIPLPDDRLQRLAIQLFGVLAGPDQAAAQAKRFLDALNRADLDPDIVANPLYFTLWLALWQSTPAPHRLPATTRSGLYGAAVDLLLTRWFRRKQAEIEQALGVPAERLRPVLETLACNLLADERRQDGNRFEFHIAELDAVLRDARVGHRREFARLDLDRVDGFLAQHAGLLALVSPRPNHYRFLHASFQEYLAASELTCAAPAQRVPPVAPARHFPRGLLQYLLAQPDAWRNTAHLAADQLRVTGRSGSLWSLLAELCAPYLASGDAVRAALLAMGIINKLPFDELPGASPSPIVTAAKQLLVDVDHVPVPAQRLIAGDALARLGDPRPGVTVRPDNGLPDIAWCEIPEFDPNGQRQFLYHDGERDTPHPGLPTFWISKYPITYAQFWAFADAPDGYCNEQWWRRPPGKNQSEAQSYWRTRDAVANRPAKDMTWEEIVAFCNWLVDKMRTHTELQSDTEIRDLLANGGVIRLPTEDEWVKAARGWNDRTELWSEPPHRGTISTTTRFDPISAPLLIPSSVGMYPQHTSPFGVEDMTGIVKEYCFEDSLTCRDGKKDLWRAFCVLRSGITSRVSERDFGAVYSTDIIGIHDVVGRGFRVVCAVSP